MALLVHGSNTHDRSKSEDLVQVAGTVVETSTIGRKTSEALRIRVAEYPMDFRLDPMYYEVLRSRAKGQELQPGMRIRLHVDGYQLRSPARPVLGPELGIVWVRGLSVDDRVLLSPLDADAADEQNDLWGVLLIALAIAAVGYYGYHWRRQTAA